METKKDTQLNALSVRLFICLLFISALLVGQSKENNLRFIKNATFNQESPVVVPIPFETIDLGAVNWSPIEEPFVTKTKITPIFPVELAEFPVYSTSTLTFTPKKIQLGLPSISKRLPFKIPDVRSLNFKYLNTSCGLPSDNILSVCEDEKGFIWAISDMGIFKISGSYIHYYDYRQNFPDCSPEKIISFNNKLYIATFGQGLFVLDGNELEIYNKEAGFFSNHLLAFDVNQEELFISYYGNGFIKVDKNNNFTQISLSEKETEDVILETKSTELGRVFVTEKGVFGILSNGFKHYRKLSHEALPVKTSLLLASNSTQFYIHIRDKGLVHYSAGNYTLIESELLNVLHKMYLSQSGDLWAFGPAGLFVVREGEIIKQYTEESYFDKLIASEFIQDRYSNIWFSSINKGIGLLSQSNFVIPNIDSQLAEQNNFVFIDAVGSKILAYKNGGLVKQDSLGFTSLLIHPNLKGIVGIDAWKNQLFIATKSGLYCIKNNTLFLYRIPFDNGLNTHTNVKVIDNEVYINNYNYGLLMLDVFDNTIQRFLNFSTNTVQTYRDKEGRIWVANQGKGVAYIHNTLIYTLNELQGSISNNINSITSDNDNSVFIGTSKGLMVIKNDSIFSTQSPFQSSGKIINCVFNTVTNKLWITNGVEILSLKFSENTYTTTKYNRAEITANGLIRPNSLVCEGKNMSLFVGGQIVSFIDIEPSHREAIPLELIELKIRNIYNDFEATFSGNTLNFSPIINSFNLESGNYDLNFYIDIKYWGKEEGLLFYYKLVGWSNNWVGPIGNNSILINNLPPGDYTLEIKGESVGDISFKPLVITFSIEQYFYKKTWFFILSLSIILVLVYFLFKTYSTFDFRSFESYTSLTDVTIKIRLLTIFAIFIFPTIEFYESIYHDFYDFEPISLIIVLSICALMLLISYSSKITYRLMYLLLITGYVTVYIIYVTKAFRIGFPASLSIEIAVMILFSKVIFTELKAYSYFFVFSVLFTITLYVFSDLYAISAENINMYFSATIQTSILVFALYLIDFNSKRSILFANKIIETTDLFVLVSNNQGRIIFVNEQLTNLTKKSEKDLLGFGWWKFRSFNEQNLKQSISSVKESILSGNAESYVNTLDIDGETIFVEWNDYILDNQYLLGIGKDITKEHVLNQQNERLSLVAKSVTNGVVVSDSNGVVLWINKSFENLFETEFSNAVGQPISALFSKGKNDGVSFQEDFLTNASFELNFSSASVSSRWLLINTTPIYDEKNNLSNYISIVTNISKRKKLETKLTEYADDLEINNLLKEQLIYNFTFEEITSVSLTTIIQKIPSIKLGSLLILNASKTSFLTYYYQNESVKKVNFAISDVKGYARLIANEICIEKDMRLLNENEISFSDKKSMIEGGIISYISLPISYDNQFIGALGLEFDTVFPLNERQISLLKNFTTLLSVAVQKIIIQQDLINKNKDITDSLFYAKSIQTSYLPQKEDLKALFKNFMLYYKPKDIVSGDFYLVEDLPNYSIIAVGDCTGHGVPGAFITMLGHNLLTQIASEMDSFSPSIIISFINEKIFYTLNKNKDTYVIDGMELGVFVYDKRNDKVKYSGAGIDLVYFQQNELKVVEAPRFMVGESLTDLEIEDTFIYLDGSEKFYLSTDGYRDQLGGNPRKRFSKTSYIQTLTEIKNLPSFQQSFIFNLKHQEHKGNHQQTDDILVIGFEL